MKRFTIDISTEGDGDTVNLSPLLAERLRELRPAGPGLVHLFVIGSTAALTTVEFEPGLVKEDLPALFHRLAPANGHYVHEATWNDDNGHAHVRASLLKPEITVPTDGAKIVAGEYQQIILIDFDTRPRRRVVVCTLMQ
ncbi:MAG TPA: YjbQ family protein [Tepidisphaeraceae bacterium]|nr:YjbQ family protein [Tepidisphaeraceae bacterium]